MQFMHILKINFLIAFSQACCSLKENFTVSFWYVAPELGNYFVLFCFSFFSLSEKQAVWSRISCESITNSSSVKDSPYLGRLVGRVCCAFFIQYSEELFLQPQLFIKGEICLFSANTVHSSVKSKGQPTTSQSI